MLQIKTFSIKESDKVNDFVKTVRLTQDGIQVRDESICVIYDVTDFGGQLLRAEAELVNAEMALEFYTLMEEAGRSDTAALAEKGKAQGAVDGAKAQIFLLKKKLGLDTHGSIVFGKKQYNDKK